jgi:hypothetical protein
MVINMARRRKSGNGLAVLAFVVFGAIGLTAKPEPGINEAREKITRERDFALKLCLKPWRGCGAEPQKSKDDANNAKAEERFSFCMNVLEKRIATQYKACGIDQIMSQ